MNNLNYIEIEKALELKDAIFVDVRSPLEYAEDKIKNAINIPLLDDEERQIVGTLYKQEGKNIAIEKGLQFTGGKLTDFYTQYSNIQKKYKNIIIYCARGGMRSESIAKFISSLGIEVYKLEGGYKSYRNYVLDFFNNAKEKFQFIVLHGLTGVGKTDILKTLMDKNINSIDLEEYAKNSGSVFGHVYFVENPPSQKYFETLIFNYMYELKSGYIFVESESKRIGAVFVPEFLYEKIIGESHRVLITSTIDSRVNRLVQQYVKNNHKDDIALLKSVEKLNKRLGNETVEFLKTKFVKRTIIPWQKS